MREGEDIYTSDQIQSRIKEYLLQRHRHTIKGLSAALGCNIKTLYRVRVGHYAEQKPYKAKEPSHNRLFRNEDFQTIREAAETVKAEHKKPPP